MSVVLKIGGNGGALRPPSPGTNFPLGGPVRHSHALPLGIWHGLSTQLSTLTPTPCGRGSELALPVPLATWDLGQHSWRSVLDC
eukprot:scaffold61285_cov30-Tisochrysis_lutea.AAC.1